MILKLYFKYRYTSSILRPIILSIIWLLLSSLYYFNNGFGIPDFYLVHGPYGSNMKRFIFCCYSISTSLLIISILLRICLAFINKKNNFHIISKEILNSSILLYFILSIEIDYLMYY